MESHLSNVSEGGGFCSLIQGRWSAKEARGHVKIMSNTRQDNESKLNRTNRDLEGVGVARVI